MKIIRNKNFPSERALYAAENVHLINCSFDGEEDGESALKEATDVKLENCFMNLRYPLWHDNGVELKSVTMTDKCRAALWYTSGVKINDSKLLGIKALRECADVSIENCETVSPEFGWKSRGVKVKDSSITSEYLFLMAADIHLEGVNFKGKYSFQYVQDCVFEDCVFDTKDAFWHAKNVTIRNSTIKGEYLAWYSENITFENCKIMESQRINASLNGALDFTRNAVGIFMIDHQRGQVILPEIPFKPMACRYFNQFMERFITQFLQFREFPAGRLFSAFFCRPGKIFKNSVLFKLPV